LILPSRLRDFSPKGLSQIGPFAVIMEYRGD